MDEFIPKYADSNLNIHTLSHLTSNTEGKGYISIENIEAAGEIPQYLKEMGSTDGSGRFCVAVFHQLHCLVS